MNVLFGVVVAVVALLGLILFFSGLRRLWRRRLITGSVRGFTGLVFLAAAALAGALALNLYTYHRLAHETAVAEVRIQAVSPQSFRLHLHLTGDAPQSFDVQGDEWQLDARILKWRGIATWLGFDTVYRLERVSGRYRDLAQERGSPRTVYKLSDDPGLDVWAFSRLYAGRLPLVDAVYGSSAYLPLADEAHYSVTVSATGLVARPANEAARAAVEKWR
jgi:hypothetical protein